MGASEPKLANIFNFNKNLTNYIKLNLNNSSKTLTFLVDTGADISLIKVNSISFNCEIDENSQLDISGITKTSTKTLGTCALKILINNNTFLQNFHVVDDDFPIATDGIIGRDFLIKTLAKINYETFTLSIFISNAEYMLPLHTNLKNPFQIYVAARSEIIHPINLNLNEDSVVLNDELVPGVFVCNTIVPSKGIAHVKILNTSQNDIVLTNFSPKLDSLENYHILKSEETSTNTSSGNRIKLLENELNLDIPQDDARLSIWTLCKEFCDIFHLKDDFLPANNFYKQSIDFNKEKPVYIKNYRLPHSQLAEIDKQVDNLLQQDIIEPCTSAYNSPLLLVPKKSANNDKKWRLVVDYRQLNKHIVDDKFPLPKLEDILDHLGNAKYFSTLDLQSSFHQIELTPESRTPTAFSTNNGQYHFKRLPFGLKISTNCFQRMLTVALSGLQWQAFMYVDDIIVFGRNVKHHNSNLRQLFERLRKFNLKLNPSKCNFLRPEVTYLGHLITKDGIKTDPSKYNVIKNYPIPTNSEDVKRFVAFCNYYRKFIENFVNISKPLNQLSKKNCDFVWSDLEKIAFDTLKYKLMNPPILQFPNFNKSFIITTDASNFALGAILSQGEIGTDLPISYASRSLNKHEIRKPIIVKELLAIHWAIGHFRPYVFGTKFFVVTDHRPLVSLFTHKNLSSKLTSIRLDLSDYDFEIIYKQGSLNTNADALSRIKITSDTLRALIPKSETADVLAITRSKTKQLQAKPKDKRIDSPEKIDHLCIWEVTSISEVRNITKLYFRIQKGLEPIKFILDNKSLQVFVSENLVSLNSTLETLIKTAKKMKITKLALGTKDELFKYTTPNELKNVYTKFEFLTDLQILIFRNPIQITNEQVMHDLIEEFHNSPHGGHSGVKRTTNKLKQKYVWKRMNKMVKKYVNQCHFCKINKQFRKTKEMLEITDTPSRTFEIMSIDTVGPKIMSDNFRYILTVQCDLSKYLIAVPIPTKEARSIAKALVDHVILIYGSFKILKSDLGTEFVNEIFVNICELLKIKHVKSTAYHHESLGSIERSHRVLNEYLLNFSDGYSWHDWVQYFTFSYNTTPHVETGFTPFELVFGRLVTLPSDIFEKTDTIYNFEDYVKEFRFKLQHAQLKAKELLNVSKNKNKVYYDKNAKPIDLKINDLVLLKVENRKKFQSPFEGPFKIVSLDNVNCTINKCNKYVTVHKNRLKKYDM